MQCKCIDNAILRRSLLDIRKVGDIFYFCPPHVCHSILHSIDKLNFLTFIFFNVMFSVKAMVFDQSCENLLGRVNYTHLRILQLPILLLRRFTWKVSTNRPACDITRSTCQEEPEKVLELFL